MSPNVPPIQLTAAVAPNVSRPSPAPSKASSANEAANRQSESNRAESSDGAPSFASTLKSQMDKKPSAENSGSGTQDKSSAAANADPDANANANSNVDTAATATTAPSVEAGSSDASAALLPFLVMANAMKETGPQASTTDSASQILDASDTALNGSAGGAEFTPVVVPIPVVLAATTANDAQSQQNAGTGTQSGNVATDPLLPMADAALGTGATDAEKLAVEAATSAGRRHGNHLSDTGAAQGEDFRAFMERATAMTTADNARSTASSAAALRVNTPMGQAGWQEEMGQKLTWMVNSNRQQADLVLTPPKLGRVEVSLILNGDQASAVFTTANPAVREALEDSMQRLREVLASAGVTLGQTQVGAETPNPFSQGGDQGQQTHSGHRGDDRFGNDVMRPLTAMLPTSVSGRGMVDTFA